MTCEHDRLRFDCEFCRLKVKTYENEIDFRMDQLGRVTETLRRIHEDEELSEGADDEIDGIIDQLKVIRYEVCNEAKIDQAQRCFSDLVRDFVSIHSAIGGDLKSRKL